MNGVRGRDRNTHRDVLGSPAGVFIGFLISILSDEIVSVTAVFKSLLTFCTIRRYNGDTNREADIITILKDYAVGIDTLIVEVLGQ